MYNFACAIVRVFMYLIFRIKVNGRENIPAEGGFILCSNHLSNWDPPLIQITVSRRIYYMAKDELFHVFGLGAILRWIKAIPVKRSGSDITSIKQSIKTVKNGDVLGIFPTGQREMVKGEGDVKAGIGFLAYKTEAPVIPVHITASYRIFSRITVNIGKPCHIPSVEGKPSATDFETAAAHIYDDIKKLAGSDVR